jgi:hypothetical protein
MARMEDAVLTYVNLEPIDRHRHGEHPRNMIWACAKKLMVLVTLTGVVAGGWGCGLMQAPPEALANGHDRLAAVPEEGSSVPMPDCHPTERDADTSVQPCAALCAVTLSFAPHVVPPVALEFGQPEYPAAPTMHDWLIQPEPYPPRA